MNTLLQTHFWLIRENTEFKRGRTNLYKILKSMGYKHREVIGSKILCEQKHMLNTLGQRERDKLSATEGRLTNKCSMEIFLTFSQSQQIFPSMDFFKIQPKLVEKSRGRWTA